MSQKYSVDWISPNRCVLPRRGNMRCDVDAFLSEALHEQSDEGVWQQAIDSASYEGVTGVYLMPDTHQGFGIPIGGVVVSEGTIIQSGSGYDISCGIALMRVPDLTAVDVAPKERREAWVREIERRVALGLGSHRAELAGKVPYRKVEDVLRHGAKALGIPEDACERRRIPVPEDVDLTKIERAYSKVALQLGSLGGGNHFIEMQVDEKDGSVWAMIHCGSRGYGWHTANHYFHEGAKLRGLPKNRREQSHLFADEPLGREYWAHHNSAANFAVANRVIISDGVRGAFREVFGVDAEFYYDISHNLVQEETVVLPDGTTKTGFVHRKGATRAFPGGHPDLEGTTWSETGHPCLIPGSMFTGAAVLFPRRGALGSGSSVNHGSGRHMARGQAKRELAPLQDDIDEEMRTTVRVLGGVEIEGVVTNTEKTPLDESDAVYKNLDRVLDVLVDEGIATVERRLWPVANVKGTD